ncbi:MAG: tRNA pseudouridine(13) synthase TruD [Gammaproteobacteria bacterium]
MKETDYIPVEELTYAHGSPVISGDVKTYNDDFVVKEISGFQPDGHGDHGFITLTKTGLTTQDVCKKLQRFCHVQQRDIGFAGLKDKNAVTTQTFSVNLAGKPEPDWQSFTEDGITVNQVSRHPRKLKRGVLKGNRFELLIRNLKGDLSKLEGRMNAIAEEGVPNYFGQQRFGNEHSNIQTALKWLKKDGINPRRNERSILISSIRSMIFNAILDRRVKNSSWAKLLKGEVINLDREWIDHLVALKLEHARRPLRIAVRDLEWKLKDEGLKLAFSLRSGAYATVVLREIVKSEGL